MVKRMPHLVTRRCSRQRMTLSPRRLSPLNAICVEWAHCYCYESWPFWCVGGCFFILKDMGRGRGLRWQHIALNITHAIFNWSVNFTLRQWAILEAVQAVDRDIRDVNWGRSRRGPLLLLLLHSQGGGGGVDAARQRNDISGLSPASGQAQTRDISSPVLQYIKLKKQTAARVCVHVCVTVCVSVCVCTVCGSKTKAWNIAGSKVSKFQREGGGVSLGATRKYALSLGWPWLGADSASTFFSCFVLK